MKTLKLLCAFAICTLLAVNTAFAQNPKSQFLFKIDSSGVIKNQSGTTFGTISKDSIIRNHNGEKIAFIDRQGNLVDANGKILGKAAKNGSYHNANGEVEYTVKSSQGNECAVYDKSGKLVGYVHNNYKAQAGCLAHCMHKSMANK